MSTRSLRKPDELEQLLDDFRIRTCGLLVDDFTPADIVLPDSVDALGAYTFSVEADGRTVAGHRAQLVAVGGDLPRCDGWLVATPSKAVHGLVTTLLRHGREQEVVLPLATWSFASMYAYVDFFAGTTSSVLHLHNAFERAYKIHFPLAVRWLLRRQDGGIEQRGQTIVPPSGTRVIDSRELAIRAGFAGYLELFADVRPLNGAVTPFLHMNCDYVSAAGIATLHQSGMRPWPASSPFVRGFVPDDPKTRLTISVVNIPNREPVNLTATLRHTIDGERRSATRTLEPLPHRHYRLIEVDDLFADEIQAGAVRADVVITADKPLHRPNNYLHPAGRPRAWTGVEHGAGPIGTLLSAERTRRYRQLGIHPWICPFPLLDERFGITTKLVFEEEGPTQLHDFALAAYDETGRLTLDQPLPLAFGDVVDLREYLRDQGVEIREGLVTVAPPREATLVPSVFTFMGGFEHAGSRYLSDVVVGGSALNVPVETERGPGGWEHPGLPIVHSELFGKAMVDDETDTILTVFNAGAPYGYAHAAETQVDLYTTEGRMARHDVTIPPNSSRTFSVAELLESTGLRSDEPYYAIWLYCRDATLYGYHIVHRASDHAIGAEHFYMARFNEPDPLLRPPVSVARQAVRRAPPPIHSALVKGRDLARRMPARRPHRTR